MKNDYYFDDLDIENFFIEDQSEPGVLPTRPGLIDTKPEQDRQKTAPRRDPMMAPVQFNADGALKDKLKAFVKSKKGKVILKITAGIGAGAVLIAFGPEIIAALAPLLPAMKGILAKQGIKAKGAGDVIKKFHATQVGDLPKDAKGGAAAKAILTGILGFFKKAKEKRAAGTASPLEELALSTADNTLKKLSEGTASVDGIIADQNNSDTPGTTKEGSESTSTEKKGLDIKLVLVILVAVFFLTKK